jgi:hypothetical protein
MRSLIIFTFHIPLRWFRALLSLNIICCHILHNIGTYKGFWIGCIGTSLQLQSIITAHNQWLSKTRSVPCWTTNVFSSTVIDLVLIYKSVTSSTATALWMNPSESDDSYVTTDGQSVSLAWNKAPTWGLQPYFFTVRHLLVCWCEVLSLMRGWVCRLQLLLALASAVILGSESRGTRDYILLSQIWDFPFRLLLRLAGLRWRYSTTPTHGIWIVQSQSHFTTGGLPPISSSWRQALWDSRPEFFSTERLR